MQIQALLLAAGRSRRFGSDKLLLPIDGEILAVRSARILLAADLPVLAVIREPESRLAACLAGLDGVTLTVCEQADRGMGLSLAWGVARSVQADAWLVGLADMPRVSTATVLTVAAALRRGASIVRPVFEGRPGHPVGFAARWRAELLTLDGDRGGRPLIEAHPQELEPIRTEDPGVLQDLDRPADLAVFRGAPRDPR